MGLQSKLFQGDQKFESCLIHDSAHIVQGAVGDHVSKIQTALSILDGLNIDSNELSARRYGPSTATAVLAFKTKRNIINTSYQFQADNIVGKMTIAALDREMFNEENRQSPVNFCLMNVRGGEIAPNPLSGAHASVLFAQTAPPVAQAAQTPQQAALQATPLAQHWTSGAISALGTLRYLQHTRDLMANPTLPFDPVFDIVNTHFHLDRERASLIRNLDRLIVVFGLIQRTLTNASTFFQNGPALARSSFANAPVGGFQLPNTQFNRITFRPGFVGCGPNTRAAMIIHECGHFVGGFNVIHHFAMEFPVPQGRPQVPPDGIGHTRNYQQLLAREALRNAASYAAYAIHDATQQDLRFGARNTTL